MCFMCFYEKWNYIFVTVIFCIPAPQSVFSRPRGLWGIITAARSPLENTSPALYTEPSPVSRAVANWSALWDGPPLA